MSFKQSAKERGKELGWISWGLILVIAGTFILGGAGLLYKSTIEKKSMDISRENFENNKSHVHSMMEDLSKYKLQLAKTTDETERKAIISFITENYATFDGKLIGNDSLREFYYDVMEGRIQ